jgi:uncharacterized repeat protein (TIGR03803 family)
VTAQLTFLFSFGGWTDVGSDTGLISDANGNLFGTIPGGPGLNNCGTVFEIQNTGTIAAPIYASAPTTLVTFNRSNGAGPFAGLTADANGDLFGTTSGGGGDGYGTVFEIQNTGTIAAPIYASAPTTLVSFYSSNGANPYGRLIADTSGDLFGTTEWGGANGDGTVFEIKNAGTVAAPVYGSGPTTLVNFNGSNGADPYAGLTADANGDLFGTTTQGGPLGGYGTVFEIQNTGTIAAPIYASTPTTLVSFDGSNGAAPVAGLIADAKGDLLGTTGNGGVNNTGVVFEIQNTGTVAAPIYASTPITLANFNCGGLISDANGDLFGTTSTGGLNNYGTVFEIQNIGTIAAPIYASAPTTLVSFNGSNGANPYGRLIADTSGDLFGTTSGVGGVFEITGAGFAVAAPPTIAGTVSSQTTTSETPVKPFAQATVGDANAGSTDMLTITLGGTGGTLSGTGLSGGVGGVYTLSGTAAAITSELDALIFTPKAGAPNTTSTTTFTLSDLSSAGGGPAVDSTTSVIDSDPSLTGQFTTLFSFNYANGSAPTAALIADASGDLFGTTLMGGPNGSGAVFEMKNSGTDGAPVYASAPITLVSFGSSGPNGFNPRAPLTADANGNLFGTTSAGGANDDGTVFEIKNAGTAAAPVYASAPTTLISFDGFNGAYSYGGLTADANGDLLGTTLGGGAYRDGTVFEIQNTGTVAAPIYASAPTTLVTFNGSNGAAPYAGLTADANGDLFGTTYRGGANDEGAVFEIKNTRTVATPVYSNTPTTLVTFNGSNGAAPAAGLISDANGDLFGTTENGGTNNCGTVFEIQNTGTIAAPIYASAPTTLVTFNGSNGASPTAGLIADANGDLFGTTLSGGAYGYGTVFEVKNTGTVAAPIYSSATTTLVSFGSNGSNGYYPGAGLTADANGNLFGTTGNGGDGGDGTVFEIPGVFQLAPAVAPTIAGTVSGQTTTSETPVRPFARVTIGDANVGANETLTITLGGTGGTLSGTGLSGGVGGVYTLSGTAAAITSELDALAFMPKTGAPGTSSTTRFTLSDQSSAGGASAIDSTTSVIDSDPAVGIGTGPVEVLAVGNQYVLGSSNGGSWTGPTLQLGHAPVTAAQLGAWAPIGAALSGGGYEVAFKNAATGQFTVWNTDASGNYLSSPTGGAVSGASIALEHLEPSFQQDLNRDGVVGLNPSRVIGTGPVEVLAVGNQYALGSSNGGSWTGPTLQLGHAPVTAAQLGAWAPIGAALSGGGYEVAFRNAATGQFTVWNTDASGNYVSSPTGGAVSGASIALEHLEPSFQQDLNRDGVVGLNPSRVIGTGPVEVLAVGNQYVLGSSNGGSWTGPTLQLGHAPVTAAQLGAWAPIGAAVSGSGYEVAFRNATTGQFTVWTTDASGNYLSSPTGGAVSGASIALEHLEPSFQQDLNRDGVVGLNPSRVVGTGPVEVLSVGNQYVLGSSNGGSWTGPTLQLGHAPVTAAQLGAWAPVGAALSGGGYEVAFKNATTGQFTVWTTDASGNYLSSATGGAVSGQSFALEDLEPSFQQDLNSDGRLSTQLVTTTSANHSMDLTGQTQATTIHLGADAATASTGLKAPSLSFSGAPDDITLGSGRSILEYALAPASGIEMIENFAYSTDLVNIDLLGKPNSSLAAFDTTVGGAHAIALFSSGDPSHGVVLLNMHDTAATLLASHTTFAGGHALIS